MLLTHDNKEYEIIVGSDVVNDGMYLELSCASEGREVLLYAFWSDTNKGFTFSAYRDQLPFELVEVFVSEARKRLPPKGE